MNDQMICKDFSGQKEQFFAFLPEDWMAEIAPEWHKYQSNNQIWGVMQDNEFIAGVIIFSQVSPDMNDRSDIANEWFQKGYLYIAYLYVNESHRKGGIGSFLLKETMHSYSEDQKFWLTVDDFSLVEFYKKLGFRLESEFINNGQTEWVLIRLEK